MSRSTLTLKFLDDLELDRYFADGLGRKLYTTHEEWYPWKTYQAVESFRWMYYRSDLAFSGHLVVLSVFDPSIGMVPEILKYQYAKHPLK